MTRLHGAVHESADAHDDPFSTPGGAAFVAALEDMVLPDETRARLTRVIEDAREQPSAETKADEAPRYKAS